MEVLVRRWWPTALAGFALGAIGLVGAGGGPSEVGLPRVPEPASASSVSSVGGIDPATVQGLRSGVTRPGSIGPMDRPANPRLLAVLFLALFGIGVQWRTAVAPSPDASLRFRYRYSAAGRSPPSLQFAPSV